MTPPPLQARLMLLAAGVLFATAGAAVKSCEGLSGPEVAALRSAIAALVLLAVLPESRRRPDLGVGLAALAYGVMLTLFATATKLTTAANVVFLQSTAPLFVLVLGPLLLGERARRRDLPILALLLVGATLFFVAAEEPTATAPNPALGNMLGAASGLAWALTLMGLRALGKRGVNAAAQATVWGNLLAVLINLPQVDPTRVLDASLVDWAMLGWLGVFQIGLAYVLIVRAVPAVPAFEVTLLLMTEPAFNPVFAWLVHGEVPGFYPICGGVLISGALVLKSWLDARSGQSVPPTSP
ncbi:MAG: DMT family transporter [Planctomycetota bacterium]